MNIILCLGIILVGAIIAEKIVNYFKIPAITSYILLGILLGPYALNITGEGLLATSELLSNIVLGFIAFHIGKNFSLENFKSIGRAILSMSIGETIGAWICVTVGIYYLAHQPFYIALLLGAIAPATAPTTTMMVIRQYKAKGKFTEILLGVVAIDDAWGIIIFSLSLSVAHVFQAGQFSEFAMLFIILKTVGKILLSLILGSTVAFLISHASVYLKRSETMLTFILGAILINTGTAIYFDLSPLLSNMFFGAILVNIDKTAFRYFDSLSNADWPLYVMFYVLAGANLEIWQLSTLGLIGTVYIIFRALGLFGGAYVGGVIVQTDNKTTRYLGLALMPQAGVAIGLAMLAKVSFPDAGVLIFNTVIATTVVFEILGPLATRYALSKAGDI
ncbi:MAG: cation:proton antiporter [Candidatus Scalindua sp.]|nr:cation:proton antiporter [Candidatus Scalindua sp.]MCR4345047.1 cation:proton antiporter [Candidatus Scalindua sp.]